MQTTECAICCEPTVELPDGTYAHTHGDVSCGTGDGSVAYPRWLYLIQECD